MFLNIPMQDFYKRHVKNLKPVGNGQLQGLCPFHEDRNPSLSVNAETGQWFCHACVIGGGPSHFAEQLGVEPPEDRKGDDIEATYDYKDEEGRLLFQVVRFRGKQFRQRRPDGSGGWVWGLKNTRRVLYRLPEWKDKATVYVVEGEKDSDRLWGIGIPATTCPMGAGKWRDEYTEQLKASGVERVVILPDNDDEGRRHAQQVALSCLKSGPTVKIVELPDLPLKGDVSDWLDAGNSKGKLAEIVKAAPLTTLEDTEGLSEDVQGPQKEETSDKHKRKGKKQDRGIELEEHEPWGEPVGTAELLESLWTSILSYVVMRREHAKTVALWVLHTYTFEMAEVTPRLVLLSPEKRCAKTLLYEVLERLVYRPLRVDNTSGPALFRAVDMSAPTVLADEISSISKRSLDDSGLENVINSGYRKSGKFLKCRPKDHIPEMWKAFGPLALAVIKEIPWDAVKDRAIVIPMRRKKKDEKVRRFRTGRTPELDELGRKATRWAEDNYDKLQQIMDTVDPEPPDELNDRAKDNWRHLTAIAELAGGQWPQEVRELALALRSDSEDEDSSAGVMLLTDLAALFAARSTDRLASQDICKALSAMEHRPWPEYRNGRPITPRQVAKLLEPFGVRPKQVRVEGRGMKGYMKHDLDDAFARYVPSPAETAKQAIEINILAESRTETTPSDVSDKNDGKTSEINDVSDVSDRTEGGRGRAVPL